MKYSLALLIAVALFWSCKSTKNCKNDYDDYIKYRINLDNNEALKKLDEAINCDPKNIDYIFEKVNYLISIKDYNSAKNELEKIAKLDSKYIDNNLLLGLLELKLGNIKKGNIILKKTKDNLLGLVNKDFNSHYNNTLLTLYFEGKEPALKQIQKTSIAKNKNDKAIINYLEKTIKSDLLPIDILYKFFNLN